MSAINNTRTPGEADEPTFHPDQHASSSTHEDAQYEEEEDVEIPDFQPPQRQQVYRPRLRADQSEERKEIEKKSLSIFRAFNGKKTGPVFQHHVPDVPYKDIKDLYEVGLDYLNEILSKMEIARVNHMGGTQLVSTFAEKALVTAEFFAITNPKLSMGYNLHGLRDQVMETENIAFFFEDLDNWVDDTLELGIYGLIARVGGQAIMKTHNHNVLRSQTLAHWQGVNGGRWSGILLGDWEDYAKKKGLSLTSKRTTLKNRLTGEATPGYINPVVEALAAEHNKHARTDQMIEAFARQATGDTRPNISDAASRAPPMNITEVTNDNAPNGTQMNGHH